VAAPAAAGAARALVRNGGQSREGLSPANVRSIVRTTVLRPSFGQVRSIVRKGRYGQRRCAPDRCPLRGPLHGTADRRPPRVDAVADAQVRRLGADSRGRRRLQAAEQVVAQVPTKAICGRWPIASVPTQPTPTRAPTRACSVPRPRRRPSAAGCYARPLLNRAASDHPKVGHRRNLRGSPSFDVAACDRDQERQKAGTLLPIWWIEWLGPSTGRGLALYGDRWAEWRVFI
jgi:hypothetical protein